jgi:hypothetical protein
MAARLTAPRWLQALVLGLLLSLMPAAATSQAGGPPLEPPVLEVFVREGCPHCAAAEAFLPELQRAHPGLQVRIRSLDHDPAALEALRQHSRREGIATPGVPSFVIDGTVLVGFDNPRGVGAQLDALVRRQQVASSGIRAGPFGTLSAGRLGLPLFSLALGLLDGFNPCAMWVLLFLLALLVHWRDRRRLALVGGTFVVVSGAVYFAFMAAWLNLFLVVGLSERLRLVLGALALVIGVVNLREIGRQGQGFTLSIPAAAKPGLYARMRTVMQSPRLLPALAGVAALAVVVNGVELLCTAGLPAVYTAVLSQQQLPAWSHYGYLGLYILGYVADDALMVGTAVLALSSNRLSERSGRWLKLLSGVVMLLLGLILLLRPGWLI